MDFDPADEIERTMDAMARPCVLMQRVVVQDGDPTRSRLGGCPNLPEAYDWPKGLMWHGGDGREIGLPFLAQFDFAEIPDPTDTLPKTGILFVFADIDGHTVWDEDEPSASSRILYVPDVPRDTPERQPPIMVVPVDDCGNRYFGDPCQSTDPEDRRAYHRWTLRFAAAKSFPAWQVLAETPAWQALRARFAARAAADPEFAAEWGNDTADDAYSERRDARVQKEHARVFGPAPAGGPKPNLKMPDPRGLPPLVQAFAWEIVEAALAAMRRECDAHADRIRVGQNKLRKDGLFGGLLSPKSSPELDVLKEQTPTLDRLLADTQALRDRLRRIPPHEALDTDTMAAVSGWLGTWVVKRDALRALTPPVFVSDPNTAYADGFRHFARRCAGDPRLREHLPGGTAAIAALYPEQAVHQMLGHFDASQEVSCLTDGSVPLLHLAYDTAPGLRICDVGELQVFIDAEDLARRNFAQARIGMQGG